MHELAVYILTAITGGIVSEINTKKGVHEKDIKGLAVRTVTSALIGVIFGYLTEYLTGSVKCAVAITAIAGVTGYPSIEWITHILKGKVESKTAR